MKMKVGHRMLVSDLYEEMIAAINAYVDAEKAATAHFYRDKAGEDEVTEVAPGAYSD